MTRRRKSTSIRQARKDTAARKRAAFEFQTPTKKPLAQARGYDLSASRTPDRRPGSEPNTPDTGALSRELSS